MLLGFADHFTGGRVQSNEHLLAQTVPSAFGGLGDQFQGVFRFGQVGRKAPLIPDGRRKPGLFQDLLEMVVNFDAAAKTFFERIEAPWLHHELLEIHGVVRVLATIQDVEHWHGEHIGPSTANVTPQRHAVLHRCGLGRRQRNRKGRVRTEV